MRLHAWYETSNREAADDVVQDAWLEIIRSIGRLREPASFRGWAFRIVTNKAADWVRRRRRQRSLVKEMAVDNRTIDHRHAIDESVCTTQSFVRQGIRTLPVESRQILSMKYIDQMSTQEISRVLGIPVGTVKSRLYYARERLRHVLEGRDHEEHR